MTRLQRSDRMAKNQRGEAVVEQNLSIDDYLLPSAAELEKLKEVDQNIVVWIMARAEQEQNARLSWNKTQEEIMRFDIRKTHRFNFVALVFTFILFIFVIAAAVYCISNGLNVEGTILGGTAIITGIIFFLQTSIKNRDKK